MTAIYLDVCCLNRPFDDQTHNRIHLEAEAVIIILTKLQEGQWQWISSQVVDFEIEQTPDPEKRNRVKRLASDAHRSVDVGQGQLERAEYLESLGFHAYDALHLACAEVGMVDVFLTTDDKLLRLARRLSEQLRIRVENPLTWLQEVIE
jgi:predicted nucleic acid-binding protein